MVGEGDAAAVRGGRLWVFAVVGPSVRDPQATLGGEPSHIAASGGSDRGDSPNSGSCLRDWAWGPCCVGE